MCHQTIRKEINDKNSNNNNENDNIKKKQESNSEAHELQKIWYITTSMIIP